MRPLGEEDERTAARKIIRSLNADARIIETNHSDVPADAILDTGLFDFEKAHEHPMWAETEEYGVSSEVYRLRRSRAPETEEYLSRGADAPYPALWWLRPRLLPLPGVRAKTPPSRVRSGAANVTGTAT